MCAVATLDSLPRRADKSFPRRRTVTHPLDNDTMLKYFLSELDVRAMFIAPRIAGDAEKKAMLADLRDQLSTFFERYANDGPSLADEAWNQAYHLERLLALIQPADMLLGEVRRRLSEATEEKIPAAARLRAAFDAAEPQIVDTNQSPPALKKNGESQLRALLLDILEEMHWTFQRKFHSRPIQKSATRRLVWIGLAACALFILPYAYIYIRLCFDDAYRLPLHNWAWLPLWTAMTSGFFGATSYP